MTTEEDANLEGSAVRAEAGYFYQRGEREYLRAETLNDATFAADAVGYTGIDGGADPDYPLYNSASGSLWIPHARVEPNAFLGYVGSSLANFLNAALLPPPAGINPNGPIEAYSGVESIPIITPEIAAAYNVKSWSVSGSVAGFPFSLTVPTGTRRNYTPDLQPGGYTTAPLTRSGYGFVVSFEDSSGDTVDGDYKYGRLVFAFGLFEGFGNKTTGVVTRYHATPSLMVPLPLITMAATEIDQAESINRQTRTFAGAVDPDQWSAAYASTDATVFGRGIILYDEMIDGESASADFTLAVTPASYWTASDPWRGEA